MSKIGNARLAACAGLALGILSGCVEAPPSGVVYVETAPPPARVEVIATAPSAEHVWIPGHYTWSGHAYAWTAGHYEVRPRHGVKWVPGHWAKYRGKWYWREGHWS
jgi:YXWGXW repeat-containing protein